MIPFDFEFFWRNLLAFVVFVCWDIGDDRWSGLQSFFLEVEYDELFGRLASPTRC